MATPTGVREHKDVYPTIDPATTFAEQAYAGKVVLITGASTGIGATIAQFYARAGASVALVARSADKLKEVIAGVPDAGSRMLSIAADVRNTRAAEDAVKQTVEKFGKLDVLIANAGVITSFNESIEKKDPETYWNTFEVNVKGVYNYVRAALPELQKTKGQIIATTTAMAYMRVENNSDYALSKLVVNGLVEFIHLEFPTTPVYALHPGIIDTNLVRGVELPDSLPAANMPFDTPELSAATMLHLTLRKAPWLSGRYYSASWDIEDVEKLYKERIVGGNALTSVLAAP
ncbi:NAD-P-binding protein [Peniophora sp. CONT]|nr:NAD-P-binding protein [Peniophora sp. CONT]